MEADNWVTIAWGGDVNLGRRFHYRANEAGTNRPSPFPSPLSSLLQETDLSIINLECVAATTGELGIDKQERAPFYYRARPEMLRTLVEAGVGVVATANNHSGDYGPQALLEQAGWLDAVGIAHTGSGSNLDEALRPAIRRAGNLNIALFSLDSTQPSFAATAERPGHAYLNLSEPEQWRTMLAPLFAAARRQAHIILVAVHWGPNNQAAPGRDEIAAGHAIIDAGADAVLGASAHRLQGIEVYKERPIIHDAGDLLFDAVRRAHTDAGLFLLDMDNSGVRRLRFLPVEVGFCQSHILTGQEAWKINRRFTRQCSALGTTLSFSPEGEGSLLLTPPAREQTTMLPAQSTAYQLESLQPLSTPNPEWTVEQIPEQVRLATPIRLGPLELLGASLAPNPLSTRGALFVESYWRLAAGTTGEDWRLDFQAHPEQGSTKLHSWGPSSDHDPCDWMWPTSRWQNGVIYRDHYSLRPQTIQHWQDSKLQLSIRLRTNEKSTGRIRLPVHAHFELSPKEAFSLLYANAPRYKVFPKERLEPPPTMLWTAKQLQQITGGKWLQPPPPDWYISAISNKPSFFLSYERPRIFVATDRRMAAQHELPSNLSGGHWDTHSKLVGLQRRKQLDGAIVAHPVSGLDPTLPVLQTDDPMRALMELGIAGRQRLQGRVVGITGSAGKTSLACMMAQAMEQDMSVQTNATTNYNSRCGILHLLANTPQETDLVVMELAISAINSPGLQHIKLARPNIAVITNIAPSHLPAGKTLSYVAQRKANIIEGVAKNGWVVLYRETEFFDYLRDRALRRKLNVMSYGSGQDADVRLEQYDVQTRVIQARLPDGKHVEYELQADGLHMALNSLACISVRIILGKDIVPFLPSLRLFSPREGRGKIHQVNYKNKQLTIIDESYNANPISVRTSLTLLRTTPSARYILILGDMLELGDDAEQYHRELAEPINELKPDCVLLCGDLMLPLWNQLNAGAGSSTNGRWYKSVKSLMNDIDQWLLDGSRILVKGSNATGLGNVVKTLIREAP